MSVNPLINVTELLHILWSSRGEEISEDLSRCMQVEFSVSATVRGRAWHLVPHVSFMFFIIKTWELGQFSSQCAVKIKGALVTEVSRSEKSLSSQRGSSLMLQYPALIWTYVMWGANEVDGQQPKQTLISTLKIVNATVLFVVARLCFKKWWRKRASVLTCWLLLDIN